MFDKMGIDITNPFQLRYKSDLPEKYFDGSKLKPGYIRTGAPIEGMDLVYKDKGRKPLTGLFKGHRRLLVHGTNPFYIYKNPVTAATDATLKLFQDQAAEAKTYRTETMKIAERAKSDRTAADKMMEDYRNMLMQEAETRMATQKQADIALRTSEANRAMSGRAPNLQIAPASQTPQTAGTQAFKRRRNMRADMTSFTPNILSTLNIQQPSVLNI